VETLEDLLWSGKNRNNLDFVFLVNKFVRVYTFFFRTSGKFVLVGLASFSVTDCAAPFPAVFSR